jgi:hypothetical protein
MGSLRGRVRRLREALRGNLESFELEGGSRYYYDPQEIHKELFLFAYDLQLGQVGEPPEFYRMLTRAKDPERVLERLEPENPERAFLNVAEMYDRDILVRERRLVSLVGEEPRDLSEGA